MRRHLLWALSAVVFGGMGAAARAESELYSDSGIDGPAYDQILQSLADLQRANPAWVTVADYGRTAQGRTLRAVVIQKPEAKALQADSSGAGRPAVLISGATHGDEYLSIEDRLPGWFVDHKESAAGVAKFLNAGGALLIIPIVNPDGYAARERENSHGVDINRDFDLLPVREPHFRENESRQLAEWVEQELTTDRLQLKLTVDYHCCNGSILFPWAYADEPLVPEDQAGFEKVAKLMRDDIDSSYDSGNTSQVLGYLGRGTSKDYYYAKYHAFAFTYEGSYRTEGQKFDKHTVFWDHLLAGLAP